VKALCIILPLCACGSQPSQTTNVPPSSSDFSPPPPDSVAFDPNVGALLAVSGGKARIGAFYVHADTTMTAAACDDPSIPSEVLIVAPFNLMTTEVTNSAYAICVDAGSCEPPDLTPPSNQLGGPPIDWRSADALTKPVVVSWALAHAFCRHYGGDLPTAAEFSRALTGDTDAYAPDNMRSVATGCWTNPNTSECSRLSSLGGEYGVTPVTLSDVGTDALDVGAFGHHDLFGNAMEWVRGPSSSTCTLALDHDVTAVADGPIQRAYWPAILAQAPGTNSNFPHEMEATTVFDDNGASAAVTPYLGFRCAFPLP
jgi:formylglycine-generating enzyme required for sulfatase activity